MSISDNATEAGLYLLAVICGCFISGLIGAAIGEKKGRKGAGFFFGILMGPLGWLLIAVGPNLNSGATGSRISNAQSEADARKKLTDLKELLDSGVINQADFDRKKQELLARM
jgi:Short C-terminal domain